MHKSSVHTTASRDTYTYMIGGHLCFQAETIMSLSVSAKDHTDQADDTSLLRVVSLL